MKVAFLHPYKMADHYFVEALETATLADLVADGHDAEAADFLFDPARAEDEQLCEMRAALDARGYELVFLERPWSDAVVHALAGLRVVAYACPELVERGLVELCIENTARRVVRELVATLARGGDPCLVPGLVYRRDGAVRRSAEGPSSTVKGELSDADFAHGRRRQLSPGASNAHRAVVLSNLGCAYRHVPNLTGLFDGVPMPADVSTAGCTFCSVQAYERMSEADAIRLIVRQIEAVLRDRPEVREIAVKDDYAVRFLGDLGDALRPLELGERLVLFSARADYLLEFRSDIEAALAGRFPAPIGFYLIGFENFSQAELERFNKGTSAAQLEAVALQMRAWSERFPGRFRVTPTGGFILFTPWTTLEDLRVNANAMRRLGFERFRGGALHSQLRLHPKQPLYWLAKRDDLLVEAFERADLSDAHRRGYRADHAWRFRDPKVGAVHRRLLDARGASDGELFAIFEDALDEGAGVARGKKARPLRMVPAPRDVGQAAPATATLSVNRACNQSCSFCVYHGREVEPPRMRAARAIQGVRAAAAEGARTLVLTGAEPTLEWYLPDLVRLARDLGLGEVVLETNATLLGEPGRAAELREAGVTRAVVAWNAADAATSDAITRDPGGHARTVLGVRALLAAGIPVELAVAVLPGHRGLLAAVATAARSVFPTTAAGVEAVVARAVSGGRTALRPGDVRLVARELAAGAAAGARAGITVRAAPGGELPPCVHDEPALAASVLRLGEIIVARDAHSHERVGACADCSVSAVCPGPVRPFAAAVAAVARPLDAARGRALVPVSAERARVLSEYRSQLFQTSPDGKLCERRIVRLNFHCNQACDFCFVSRELPAVEHELIVKELEEVAAAGAALDLSGGEPTLHPRLPEYLALGARLGIAEVELQTNAIKMADAAYARELVDAGLRRAFVSLHGTSATVSDRVTAAPGTFDRTVAGVKNLVALGVTVRLNFVLCGYNVAELADFPDFVARELAGGHGAGARVGVNLSFVAASTDNVPRDTGLIPRFSDIAWALAAAVERARALGMDLTGLDSKCGVPGCYMPAALRDRHFAHDIPAEERRLAAPGFTKSEACLRCELDARCYGIRSTYAELYGTAELRPIVAGEVQPHATPLAAPATLRGTAWAAIGLAPGHELRPGSVARLVDDAAFARLERTWVQALAANPDREVVQLTHGLRDLIKVERSTVAAAEETAAAYRERGLSAAVFTGPPGPGGSARRAIAFVAREPKALDEALAVEPAMTGPHDERAPLVRRMGRLLGYPDCCVAAFAAAPEQDDATHVARLARLHPGTLRPEQNWAALPLRPFSHFPCTPTCEATARLGRATLALLGELGPDVGPKLERALGSVALVAAVDRFALLLAPRPDGPGAWTYEEVLSHRNLGTDDAVLRRPAFRAFYLEVIAPLEEGRRVVRTPDALVVERDGQRIAAIAFAAGAPPLLDFTGR